MAQAYSAMTRLAILWGKTKPTKIKLYKLFVPSVRFYGYESWALSADQERRIQAFEIKCFRRLFTISYREHKTKEYVWYEVDVLTRRQELLLSTVPSYHGSAISVVMIRC